MLTHLLITFSLCGPCSTKDTIHDVVDPTPFIALWKGASAQGKLDTRAVHDTLFQQWFAAIQDARPDDAHPWAQRAYWLHAWHGWFLIVANRYAGKRTLSVDSTWRTRDTVVIAGYRHTLESLEGRVRECFGTCASALLLGTGNVAGFPLLQDMPRATTVERALRHRTRSLARSERFVLWDPGDDVLHVHRSFERLETAMVKEAGSVVAFLLPFMSDAMAAAVALRAAKVRIFYADVLDRWHRRY
ncbi:MAG: hypothetical protein MUC47_09965 [Candidatus Kapabacteria bacterium]|nr:hypothetical protein [Candidatus Kapabacteria bacterium]